MLKFLMHPAIGRRSSRRWLSQLEKSGYRNPCEWQWRSHIYPWIPGEHKTNSMRRILHSLLKIDPREVDFLRRGFTPGRAEVRRHLERVAGVFLHGYHVALRYQDQAELIARLSAVEAADQGFAYEGAAMAMALLDGMSPAGGRFRRFAAGAGRRHIYMLHVGAGWACARLPWLRSRIESAIQRYHPLLRWLAIDGYGFHEGYFHGPVKAQARIAGIRGTPYLRQIFYQGLGRSLWFSCAARPETIAQTIATFAPHYQAEAWSGAGLACAYAGGVTQETVEDLRQLAGPHWSSAAQGAAFAAKARQLAGNLTQHTEMASAILCHRPTEQAAALCDEALSLLDQNHPCQYQQWREILRQKLERGISNESPTIMVSSAGR
jgi:hypothetical protein